MGRVHVVVDQLVFYLATAPNSIWELMVVQCRKKSCINCQVRRNNDINPFCRWTSLTRSNKRPRDGEQFRESFIFVSHLRLPGWNGTTNVVEGLQIGDCDSSLRVFVFLHFTTTDLRNIQCGMQSKWISAAQTGALNVGTENSIRYVMSQNQVYNPSPRPIRFDCNSGRSIAVSQNAPSVLSPRVGRCRVLIHKYIMFHRCTTVAYPYHASGWPVNIAINNATDGPAILCHSDPKRKARP